LQLIAFLLLCMLVLFIFCYIVLEISHQWVILTIFLQQKRGISGTLLSTPVIAAFVFQFLVAQMQMSLRKALAISILAAYPLAHAFSAQPDLMTALTSLAVTLEMSSVTA